jgi:hypothetical protein
MLPVERDVLGFRQKIRKKLLIGLAKLSEVVPAASDIGANMKDHNTLVERVSGCILLDRPHDTSDELHKGAETGTDRTSAKR